MSLVIRHHPESAAAEIELDSGFRKNQGKLVYGPVFSPDPERTGLDLFNRVAAYVRRHNLAAKLELVNLDGEPMVRVRRLGLPMAYRLVDGRVPVEKALCFLNRHSFQKAPRITVKSGKRNVVVGRYGEKLLHEWLSHPAESGFPLPSGITMSAVVPNYDSPDQPRLVRGHIHAGLVPVPDNWLLIRSVETGSFDEVSGIVSVTVREAFARRDHLVQSVHPFRFRVTFEALSRCFSGSLSRKTVTEGGFFCRKFGEHVFGRIESPPLVFRALPLNVEDHHES